MSLLKQNITKKRQVDKNTTTKLKFEAGNNNEEYKVEKICNNVVFRKESNAGYLPRLYYLIF